MQVQSFTFNSFQENTYVLFDKTKEAIIIDPGCYEDIEYQQLFDFIEQNQLIVKAIVNTHCHIDHVLGVYKTLKQYNVDFYCHKGEQIVLDAIPGYAPVYGLNYFPFDNVKYISESETFKFGETMLELRYTPGHSPASLCFIHHDSKQIIAGDVLFAGSIGRTDLPGGDYATLMSSIETQLLPLADDYKVYPGHGPDTTVGAERQANPFILEWLNK